MSQAKRVGRAISFLALTCDHRSNFLGPDLTGHYRFLKLNTFNVRGIFQLPLLSALASVILRLADGCNSACSSKSSQVVRRARIVRRSTSPSPTAFRMAAGAPKAGALRMGRYRLD